MSETRQEQAVEPELTAQPEQAVEPTPADGPEPQEVVEPEQTAPSEPAVQPEPVAAAPAPFVPPEPQPAPVPTPVPVPAGHAVAPAPLVPPAPVPGAGYTAAASVPHALDPQLAVYPAEALRPPKPKRHFPWRWVGAVVVLVAVGAGSAYGVMTPKRTDLPGLKTAADGRYDFAPLTLPALAPGQSDPTSTANNGNQHLSDIRKLLLPAPKGATADHSLPGATGWVSESASLALLGSPGAKPAFGNNGWRHTAGTAWKTPDGADTKIYLMQFIDASSAANADSAFAEFGTGGSASATKELTATDATTVAYTTMKSGGKTTYYGTVTVGDTEFLIEFTAPASVGIVPFKQEIDLQLELLQ